MTRKDKGQVDYRPAAPFSSVRCSTCIMSRLLAGIGRDVCDDYDPRRTA